MGKGLKRGILKEEFENDPDLKGCAATEDIRS